MTDLAENERLLAEATAIARQILELRKQLPVLEDVSFNLRGGEAETERYRQVVALDDSLRRLQLDVQDDCDELARAVALGRRYGDRAAHGQEEGSDDEE